MNLKRLRRRAGFHLLRTLAAQRAGRGMAAVARTGDALGRWHHRLARRQRRHLERQLGQLFGLAPGDPGPAAWLEESYRLNDRAIFEILAMYSGRASIDDVAAHCRVDQLGVLDQALSEQRGAVLLGWHMGNGVAMATRLAHSGYPVSVVYRESRKIQPEFYPRGLGFMGLDAIGAQPAAVGFRRMLKALKSNRVIYILMDQGIKRGVETLFLGKRVPMPPGPAELVRRTGCALLTAPLIGVEPHWRFGLERPDALDPDEALETSIEKLSRIMENRILERPEWWTWHQRRWPRYEFAEGHRHPPDRDRDRIEEDS
jgi:KDO2-lipid IV(A) lauroyltransferase